MHEDVDLLLQFADSVVDRVDSIVLLGMGGSSLAPEVLRRTFRQEAFHVLDTTHPQAIRDLEAKIDVARTLFVSASKSGSTLETRSHTDYFWEQSRRGELLGRRSPIPAPRSRSSRCERGLRVRSSPGEPTIGGRYSALSAFGMVPAALMGVDVARLLDAGAARWPRRAGSPRATRASSSASRSARAGSDGRDKVCIDPNPGGFGLWAEQLIAESTGKQGKGLDPGARASRADGPDRQAQEVRVADAVRARPGVLPLGVRDRRRRLDPRHQPVRPARRAGGEGQDEARCSPPARSRDVEPVGLGRGAVRAGAARATTSASRRSSTRRARDRGEACSSSRRGRAQATGCVVTHGFGPRYLHSTGQLHKGGPPTGLFLQVVDDTGDELAIPGQPFGFGKLIRAQAAGDFASLQERGRRVARIRLEEVIDAARNDRPRPHGRQHDEAARASAATT